MALRTLRSINKQVEEMKAQTIVAQTAANAARLNAQAVIDAERAWIFAELVACRSEFVSADASSRV